MTTRWLHTVLGLLMAGSLPLFAEQDPATLDQGLINPGYEEKPSWFKHSFLDIREDVADAAQQGRRVVLYFYQDGCPYCRKLLRENFAIRDIVERTRSGFDVVAINMWGDREVVGFDGEDTTEKAFATSLRVMFTPTMLFLGEHGEVVLRVNGYYPPHKFAAALEYASGGHESGLSFRQFYAARAPREGAGRLHEDPAFLARPLRLQATDRVTRRPLLVLFEQPYCPPCDELHLDIMQRAQTRKLLEGFDVALLDMWSSEEVITPDGRHLQAREWAKTLDVKYVPSLVFFDDQGKEVFRTEAYLRAFHIQSALDYVASDDYRTQPEFQRYIAARADTLEAQGIHVELMR